jgi:hypothetical protein
MPSYHETIDPSHASSEQLEGLSACTQDDFDVLCLGHATAASPEVCAGRHESEDTTLDQLLLSSHLDGQEVSERGSHEVAHTRSPVDIECSSSDCSRHAGRSMGARRLAGSKAAICGKILDLHALLERCGDDLELVAAVMESFCSQVNTHGADAYHCTLPFSLGFFSPETGSLVDGIRTCIVF